MYAVIHASGKQHRVAPGDFLTFNRLADAVGAAVVFPEVLLLHNGTSVTVGAPLVAGASVTAEVIEHGQGDKVLVFKKKRRHNYRRKNGHRQQLTTVRITGIKGA